jgi:hypothetical protein
MANTFIKIASVTVGSGGASSVTFSSIPSTYTDLCLKVSLRSNASAVYDYIKLTFNNNTGSVYSLRNIRGNGATVVSQSLSTTFIEVEMVNGNTATASTFSNTEIYVPNYAGSNNKSVSIDSVQETNATTAYAALTAALFSSSSAISSIELKPSSGSLWQQYSTATLYGINKS